MEDKIWSIAETAELSDTPYEILDAYASKLKDNVGFVEGLVTELISETREEIVCTLYLVVPELRNYSYRLIEVTQPNAFTFYPVEMRLFGKSDGSIIEEHNVSYSDFEIKLLNFIQSPVTKGILRELKKHLDIAKKHNL